MMIKQLISLLLFSCVLSISALSFAEERNCSTEYSSLKELVDRDQNLRANQDSALVNADANRQLDMLNRSNADALSNVLKKCGWPRPLGGEYSFYAWLIVQHSDHDIAFQKTILEMLRPEVMKGAFDKLSFAKLIDRVSLNSGGKQVYGTQLTVSGIQVWLPKQEIESEEAVERHRRELGIETLDAYLERARRRVVEDSQTTSMSHAPRSH